MAKAQRLRWKKIKHAAEPTVEVARPKRKLSAAVRKRMAAAQKKRWAAIKGKSVLETAVAKKAPAPKTGARNVGSRFSEGPEVARQKATVRRKVRRAPQQAAVQAPGQ
jgi:hypothetical protein